MWYRALSTLSLAHLNPLLSSPCPNLRTPQSQHRPSYPQIEQIIIQRCLSWQCSGHILQSLRSHHACSLPNVATYLSSPVQTRFEPLCQATRHRYLRVPTLRCPHHRATHSDDRTIQWVDAVQLKKRNRSEKHDSKSANHSTQAFTPTRAVDRAVSQPQALKKSPTLAFMRTQK